MANAKTEQVTFTFTEPVRAGFLNVIEGRQFKGKGDARFDGSFILEPDSADFVTLKTLVIAEAKKFFPGKKLVARRLTQDEINDGGFVEINVPWKDGTKLADAAKNAVDDNGNPKPKDQEFFRGKIVVKASSKYAPALSGIENGKVVEYDKPETRATLAKTFYAGAYLVPHVALNPYKAQENKPGGVSLYFNAVCFIKHGAKLTGGKGVNAAEVFKGYAGKAVADNPGSNVELDDEIPF